MVRRLALAKPVSESPELASPSLDAVRMKKKYGRTYHLPISPGATSDDKVMQSIDALIASELVVTEKMDGENTTIHRQGNHARSLDSRYHPSRDWLKAFAAGISTQLSQDERVVGEYLFARHSVGYDCLPSYFLGFAWIVGEIVQSWDDTTERFADLGITPVPILFRGAYRPRLFEELAKSLDLRQQEGFVVRDAGAFAESDMPARVGKYVREGHVQSGTHWMKAEVVRNGLA
ncbi:RNA ligase family protein [Mesorhizobium sp. LHD-90]|uniref:RNA ligase family protein n=1 Tax=Mesorhizobium sp. LHD-90 TaxID=3071414 RepID=UPI0027E181D3|nr:RNA ligase family protein [Mesorhizobium sp. LHD-90]MDQ6435939.1 RNA ligase family protein [Mesorhizobium sp. LHD-90]